MKSPGLHRRRCAHFKRTLRIYCIVLPREENRWVRTNTLRIKRIKRAAGGVVRVVHRAELSKHGAGAACSRRFTGGGTKRRRRAKKNFDE